MTARQFTSSTPTDRTTRAVTPSPDEPKIIYGDWRDEPEPPAPIEVIDLGGDRAETTIIEIRKVRYRVRKDIAEADPDDFHQPPSDDSRFCCVCGYELGRHHPISPFLGPLDMRCLVHQEPSREWHTPRCTYCRNFMRLALPLEAPGHSLRYLWACPDSHSHLVTTDIRGIR